MSHVEKQKASRQKAADKFQQWPQTAGRIKTMEREVDSAP